MQKKRLVVALSPDEYKRLERLAQDEDRPTEQHAARLLKRALATERDREAEAGR